MSYINSNADNIAVRMFQICWFISTPLAFITYNTIKYIFPPLGHAIQAFIPDELVQEGYRD